MKVIISRKGFDSGYGGVASPIMPDGHMVSFPIPGYSMTRYRDIQLPFANTHDLVSHLTKEKITGKTPVHFDPDLNPIHLERKEGWLGSLGQTGGAQGHLESQNVSPGDLFLFFGWFRETDYKDERHIFKAKSPDLHVLFGYLQIGEILKLGGNPDKEKILKNYPWLEGHPHLYGTRDEKNTLYIASQTLKINGMETGLAGAGTFEKFKPDLCLTAPNQKSRSLWKVPSWLKPPIDDNALLSYHGDNKRWSQDEEGNHLLQSVAKGQEFVTEIKDIEEFTSWFTQLALNPKKKLKI